MTAAYTKELDIHPVTEGPEQRIIKDLTFDLQFGSKLMKSQHRAAIVVFSYRFIVSSVLIKLIKYEQDLIKRPCVRS